MTLVVHPFAHTELRLLAVEYDAARTGVGDELVIDFEQAVAVIAADPTGPPDAGEGVRGVLMVRFPCVVCYRVRPDQSVIVVGLIHRPDAARVWLIG